MSERASGGVVKVLVIDDSAYNRQTITSILESQPGIRVVARAGDGDEGLKMVFAHQPDVITLDLEMPRMDGFTFLRILMQRRPTPVLVISGQSRRENVFKALELGALEFIAKPTQKASPELREIERDLIEKLMLVARLKPVALGPEASVAVTGPAVAIVPPRPGLELGRIVVVGASTGGPAVLQKIVPDLPADTAAAFVVAQHMPPKFTQAFAERLDRGTPLEVREARDGEEIRPGLILVAPGGAVTTVVRDEEGVVRTAVRAATADDRFVPSVDLLFETAAGALGSDVMGVVLTGMGGDGARGVKAIRAAGGVIIAQSPESAVIPGMPEEAIRTGGVSDVLPVSQLARAIDRFIRR
jgi:two-component system chemotaxis response regulator CheB